MANAHWNTPKWILDLVRKCGEIDLDPCSNPLSIVHAKHEYGNCPEIPGDGLRVRWELHGLVFINMRFDSIYPWTRKAGKTRLLIPRNPQCQIIATVPADRTETKAWEPIWNTADTIALTRKRVRWMLNGKQSDTTRGSTGIIYWGLRPNKFKEVFKSKCRVITDWT